MLVSCVSHTLNTKAEYGSMTDSEVVMILLLISVQKKWDLKLDSMVLGSLICEPTTFITKHSSISV